jgi:integrase
MVDKNESQSTQIKEYATYRIKNLNRSIDTVKCEKITLKKLAKFLKNKKFEDVTEKDLQEFFRTLNGARRSIDLYALHIKVFYKWLLKLRKREQPRIMDWYENITAKEIRKNQSANPMKEFFISKSDYEKIQRGSLDVHGMKEALWETFYLSGGRRKEIAEMKIKDVNNKDGNVTIYLEESKTIPRTVPLSEPPNKLLRWIGNHPFRDNPESPLWISFSNNRYLQQLDILSINFLLDECAKKGKLGRKITPHCFRKTRATIVFNERSKDGGLVFTDKQIALFFGWTLSTVAKRREEYDLSTSIELRKIIFSNNTKATESYDNIKKEISAMFF